MESAHLAYLVSTNQRPHQLLAFPVPLVTFPIALHYLHVHRVRLDFTLPPLDKNHAMLALPARTTIKWRPKRCAKFVYQVLIKIQGAVPPANFAHRVKNWLWQTQQSITTICPIAMIVESFNSIHLKGMPKSAIYV